MRRAKFLGALQTMDGQTITLLEAAGVPAEAPWWWGSCAVATEARFGHGLRPGSEERWNRWREDLPNVLTRIDENWILPNLSAFRAMARGGSR